MLQLEHVHSGYDRVKIITDVSLHVDEGEIVTIIGPNGAGKSSLLKTISGLLRCTEGRILFDGIDISKLPPHRIVELGIIQVAEGRQIFAELTVRENLMLGCYFRYVKLGSQGRKRLVDYVCELFPILGRRIGQLAGTLSGGEQQMLAIGRALMGEPRLLLTDEPSLGLAPIVVDSVCAALTELNKRGLTVLMVEQNALVALTMAQHAYILEDGSVALEGDSPELLQNDKVRESYLGI